jgi:predicted outer membrane repeat protein
VPGDYATIQAAIDAAVVGDVVEVACGTYAVPEIIMKSGITLRSETGEPECVIATPIDPLVEGRLLRCVVDATTTIEGVTFKEGSMNYNEGGPILFVGSPTITNCHFVSNMGAFPLATRAGRESKESASGFSGAAIVFENSYSTVTNCLFSNNGADPSAIRMSGGAIFTSCVFEENYANNVPVGAISSQGATFIDCVFSSNRSHVLGGAVECWSTTFESCTFSNNSVFGLYGGAAVVRGSASFSECVFFQNSSRSGGAIYVASSHANVNACTFVANYAPYLARNVLTQFGVGSGRTGELNSGSAIAIEGDASATLTNIIAFANIGSEAISCELGASISISCSNVFGNPDGDWVGCIADQLGVNGNISVDPMFCDVLGEDFYLSSLSPCLYAECGVMGALGQGCFDEKPALYQVQDVGNDQGRQVRLTWQRSLYDSPAANPYVAGYAVYRKKEQFASAESKGAPLPQSARGEGVAILGWDYLGTVPSRGDSVYETVAPTLCDSTITGGQCLSTFFISAMTTNPFVFYDSPQASGYSKDNLAPPTPTGFAVAYNTGSGNQLAWDAVAAADFAGFHIYRATQPIFIPAAGTLVATTTQTSWTDPDFDGWNVHYEVASFDVAGNESTPSAGGTTTAIPLAKPRQLELLPNVPNPFNPTTRIPYTTPSEGSVRIAIYDARGSLVRVVVDKTIPAGHYDAVWDGRDAKGAPVSSGIYLCRLEHRSDVRTRKIVLIK